jgi:hypothetical protein
LLQHGIVLRYSFGGDGASDFHVPGHRPEGRRARYCGQLGGGLSLGAHVLSQPEVCQYKAHKSHYSYKA